MPVKSRRKEVYLEDLRETFDTLRSYNMKLNLDKCAFGVMARKFLGFMVSQRGIEVNPDKIQAIIEMAPPRNVKEVQSLNGKIAALNRFMSRAMDKCLPFFRALKKSFEWMIGCQQEFEDLKTYLSSPPLLSPSQPGEELFLYLVVSSTTVSAALIKEEDKVQKPVYYISQALRGAEERYLSMEKLAFTLVTTVRKLKPYFQAHTYCPCTAIKGHVVADFIMEFTNVECHGVGEYPQWSIHTDGSSNRRAGGVGIVLRSPEEDKIECMVCLDFLMTNNEAEYETLVAGLDLAKATRATSVIIHYDSQVVTNQVNGDYECKGERMKKYLEQVKRRVDDLQAKIVQIPREENEQADRLTKAVSAEHMVIPDKVLSFIQLSPLIDVTDMQEISSKSNWTTLLISYLKDGTLPDGKKDARKLKVQVARFVLINDVLYKRGFSRLYLRCLSLEEVDYVMREVHEGICGNHLRSQSLVHKLIRARYY
nr:uncharacterized protein LOC111990138 [Quercus suber]